MTLTPQSINKQTPVYNMKYKSLLLLIVSVLLLSVSNISSQDHGTDIRDINKLKNIIEGDGKYPLTLLNKNEAILFLGYFGRSTDSAYLCNLLNNEKFKENYLPIVRALGLLRSDDSVLCLIQNLKKNVNTLDKLHIYDALIYSIKDSSREKNAIIQLEKEMRESKGEIRENFRQLLIRITDDKSGKYIEGINFEEIDTIFAAKGLPTERLTSKTFALSLKSNDYELLLPHLESVVKKNKELWVGYLLKGYCLYLLKKYDEAEINFKKSIELNQRDSNSYFYLGDIYSIKGEKSVAKQYYENGIKYSPSVINKIIINEKIEILGNIPQK